jgi:flagellar basal body-associated protein FliL
VRPEQSAGQRRGSGSGAVLLVIASVVLAIALNAGFTLWAISSSQATQKQQGLAVERKICTTLAQLADLKRWK